MLKRILVLTGILLVSHAPVVGTQSSNAVQQPSGARTVLDQYCVTCHNQRSAIAGLMLGSRRYAIRRRLPH